MSSEHEESAPVVFTYPRSPKMGWGPLGTWLDEANLTSLQTSTITGIGVGAVRRWKRDGYLRRNVAQRVAEALKFDPLTLWPDWDTAPPEICERINGNRGRKQTTYPWEPLGEWLTENGVTYAKAEAMTGTSSSTFRRWERQGVPRHGAGQITRLLGVETCSLWPDWQQAKRIRDTKTTRQLRVPPMDWEPLQQHLTSEGMSSVGAATRSGVTVQTFQRWKRRGLLPFWSADNIAIRLGVHPSQIWTNWYDHPTENVKETV